MSSWTHNDLQSGQNNSESTSIVERFSNPQNEDGAQDTPATDVARGYLPRDRFFSLPSLPEGIITLKELNTVKLTAQFVSFYGEFFRKDLWERVSANPLYASQFQFMKPGDSRNFFYRKIRRIYVCVYMRSQKLIDPMKFGGNCSAPYIEAFLQIIGQVLEEDKHEGVDMAMIQLSAVECLFNMEYFIDSRPPRHPDAQGSLLGGLPPPQYPLVLPQGITLQQLNIITLTARFVEYFGMDLMRSVLDEPELRMLLLQESVSSFFICLYSMYKRVLKSTPKLGITLTDRRQREAVLDVFSKLLGQLVEKKEEVVGVEMAMIELHAFEYFASSDWMIIPENLSIPRNPPPQMQPPLGSQADVAATDDAERYLQPRPPPKPPIYVILSYSYGITLKDPQPPGDRFFSLPSLPEGIITLKELNTVKLTAQFVSFYGEFFRKDLWERVSANPLYASQFQFMKRGDSRNFFYRKLLRIYVCVYKRSQKLIDPMKFGGNCTAPYIEAFLQIFGQVPEEDKHEGVDMAMIQLSAVECLFNMEYFIDSRPPRHPDAQGSLLGGLPPPQYPLVLPQGITLQQLNIITLTARFVAYFGMDLMTSVFDKPEFAMVLLQKGVSSFFNCLYIMYKRVLNSTPKQGITLTDRQGEAVLEVFSKLLGQLVEKKEEVVGVEMAMIELRAFEYIASYDWMEPPENLSIPRNPPPQMQPPLHLPEDPDQKRQKFEESAAFVPKGQFIGQHPGSSTTRVSDGEDGKVYMNITVESLSENVADLKEKIAGEFQIPAYKQKLFGTYGFLKDTMSLAEYVARVGETITLSF